MTAEEFDAAFLDNIVPVPESGCHVWLGTVTKGGYGQMANRYLHRYAYERINGPVPDSLQVLHRCDVRCCVNPDHLFIGTHQDNHDDKINKGRARGGSMPGEVHPMHKLTEADVKQIRKEYAEGGVTQWGLAKRYGVIQGTISSIVLGKIWRHI